MGGLLSLALRSLAARRGRTLLSVVGVALGIAVLYASLATDAGITASIDHTVRDLVGRADLRVEAFGPSGLSQASVAAVEGAPGVVTAAPALQRRTYLSAAAGQAAPAAPVTVLGVDPAAEAEVRDLVLKAGHGLTGPTAKGALVTETLAATDGLALGGTVTILGPDGPVDLPIEGILAGDGPVVGDAGRTVLLPLATMQALFADPTVSRVDVVAGEGATPAEVADAIGVALTSQAYVLSSPAEIGASLRSSTVDFRSTTALIAAVALFVGAFLIFNTLSMTVTERIRELGLLRAAGATRGQLIGFVLVQAVALGILGSVLGLAIGFVLAELIALELRTVAAIPFERVDPQAVSIVAILAIGLGVTIAAGLEPARRAGSIPPVEALRVRSEPSAARRARLRWLIAVFVAVGVAGLIVWPRDLGPEGLVRSALVYLVLLGAVLVAPVVLGALGRIAGLPFRLLFRPEERLARAAIVRDRSRTTLTVGALAIGLAMVVAIGTVAHQSRLAASAWLEAVIPGDELLTSIRPIALDEDVIGDVAAIPGVKQVSPLASFDVARDGVRLEAAAVHGSDLRDDGRLRFVDGDRNAALAGLDEGGVAILPQTVAERTGLTVGSTLTLAVGDGRVVDLRVAGIVDRSLPGSVGEAVLIGWPDATNTFGVTGADVLAVRYEPGAEATARPEVDQLAAESALQPTSLESVAGAVDDALGQVFGLFDALALVAVLVAALGIVNTLTVSVLERVRELGVLRAAGMTRSQVRRTVVVEAGILGLVGAALGIVTGLLAAAILIGLAGGAPLILDVPWLAIGAAVVLGVGVSMLAAWYPARLASRLPIVAAVQHE